jgi:hypothetical protein
MSTLHRRGYKNFHYMVKNRVKINLGNVSDFSEGSSRTRISVSVVQFSPSILKIKNPS